MRNFLDKNVIKLVEHSKSELISNLNQKFVDIKLSELPYISESLEDEIIFYFINIIKQYANLFFLLNVSTDGNYLQDKSKSLFRFLHACNINNPNQYLIRLIETNTKSMTQNFEFKIDINGYGKYSEVVFIIPQNIKSKTKIQILEYWIKEIFETAYFWFFKTTSDLVNNECHNLSERLYSYIHKYVTEEELRKNLWFSAITDGYGFRLINKDVTEESFELIKMHLPINDYSTNRHVSELLSTFLPENIMLMKKAFDENKCITVSLKDAKYKQQGSIYATTLYSLYGCDSFTFYPIYIGSHLRIACTFEAKDKKYIVPILDEHKASLYEICEEETEKIKRILKILKVEKLKVFWDAIKMEPNIMGFGINLKKFFEMKKTKNR